MSEAHAERSALTVAQMRMKRRGQALAVLAPASLLLAFFLFWEAAVHLRDVSPYVLPPPSAVLESLWTDRALLAPEAWVTMQEILLGFGLAFAVAMTLGFVLSHSVVLNRTLYPLLVASQTIPVLAIAPVLLIWFGYGMLPKVIVTALIAFFPLTVNTVTGFGSVDPEMKTLFRAYKGGRWQTFRKLTLPWAMPYIMAGVKISITLSVIGATVGEWIGADAGLGFVIVQSGSQLLTARLFAALTLLSLIGIVLFVLAVILERVLIPWRPKSGE
jgi:ABC-type nitrate/sulfonate/bicarbonate transport system permease component